MVPDPSERGLWEEYRYLRAEIAANDRMCQWLTGVTTALLLALLCLFTAEAPSDYLLYGAWGVYLVYLQMLLRKYEGTARVASYIAVFLEPKLAGLGWEGRLRAHPAPKIGFLSRALRWARGPEVLLLFLMVMGILGAVSGETMRMAAGPNPHGIDSASWAEAARGPLLLWTFAFTVYSGLAIRRVRRICDPELGWMARWQQLKTQQE